ncbi:unnamed protein product [Somion occarium]
MTHIRSEHKKQLESKEFVCPEPKCGETFTSQTTCLIHYKNHFGIKDEICDQYIPDPSDPNKMVKCTWASAHPKSLNRHKHREHPGTWSPKDTGRAITKKRKLGLHTAPNKKPNKKLRRAESEESIMSSSSETSTWTSSCASASSTEDIWTDIPSAVVKSVQWSPAYDDSEGYVPTSSTSYLHVDAPDPIEFTFAPAPNLVEQDDPVQTLEEYLSYIQPHAGDAPYNALQDESLWSQPVTPPFGNDPSACFQESDPSLIFSAIDYPSSGYHEPQPFPPTFPSDLGFAFPEAPFGGF